MGEMDVFRCPMCLSKMQRIAWILDPIAIRKILDSVGLATDSPEPHPPKYSEEFN
jgi:hypothetical protein